MFSSSQPKKIYVLLGHPDADTVCGTLANVYEEAARLAGHEVRRANIGELKFDPVLHLGYKTIQNLEPDLVKVQEDIKWADHIMLIYPMWWSCMPAILKGLFDRMWLPGFAYHFNHNHMGWHKLLKGKSARVIITMDSWPTVSRILFGDSTNEISRAILWFSGIHPVRLKKIGNVKNLTDEKKQRWADKVAKWAAKAR